MAVWGAVITSNHAIVLLLTDEDLSSDSKILLSFRVAFTVLLLTSSLYISFFAVATNLRQIWLLAEGGARMLLLLFKEEVVTS
jgi:hypothetical protein